MFVNLLYLKSTTLSNSVHIPVLWKQYSYWISLILLLSYFLWNSTRVPIGDFANYYFGSHLFVNGQFTSEVYFPEFFNQEIYNQFTDYYFMSYAPNSPFIAMAFVPLTIFPIGLAKFLFNFSTSLLFIFSILKLQNAHPISTKLVALVPLLFIIPIKNQILFGQLYFLLFFLLVLGYLALRKEQFWLMGLFWGLAISLKIFPLIVFGYLALNKKWKGIFTLGLFVILLNASTLLTVNVDVWKFYFTEILQRANNGEIAGMFVDNYQTLYMFLKRIFVFHPVENPKALFHAPMLFSSLLWTIKSFLLLFLVWVTLKENKKPGFVLSIWLFVSLLLIAYGSTYSHLILIPLIWSFLRGGGRINILLVMAITIAVNSSVIEIPYLRLLFLIFAFGILLWKLRSEIPYTLIASVSVGIGIILFLILPVPTKDRYATLENMPILSHDYDIKNDEIRISYWNQNGPQEYWVKSTMELKDPQKVRIANNQVLYNGEPITHSTGNKKNALRINENQILFLSDQGRGIGFYQLRIIEIEK